MRSARRIASLTLAALVFSAGLAFAALPDSDMADTAPAAPVFAPPDRKPDPPPVRSSGRPNRSIEAGRKRSRPAAKRPTPPRAASKKASPPPADVEG
jgi:hypothetical protein